MIGSDAGIALDPGYYFSKGRISVAWLGIDSMTKGAAAYHKDLTDSVNWDLSKTGRFAYTYMLEIHPDDLKKKIRERKGQLFRAALFLT